MVPKWDVSLVGVRQVDILKIIRFKVAEIAISLFGGAKSGCIPSWGTPSWDIENYKV